MLIDAFRGDEALEARLLTRAELYGPRFRRLYPGVFVPAALKVDLRSVPGRPTCGLETGVGCWRVTPLA